MVLKGLKDTPTWLKVTTTSEDPNPHPLKNLRNIILIYDGISMNLQGFLFTNMASLAIDELNMFDTLLTYCQTSNIRYNFVGNNIVDH